jgi:penicillin-binding protein-related factor A (putative recombinase)
MNREKDLQDECLGYLEQRGIYHVNTHGNAWERRGRPDIYLCYKGHFIGCELKRGREETPTPLQLKHLREIRSNGGIGVWITTLQELIDLLNSLDR